METYEVASAFVRLRPKADPNFARDAEQQLGSPLKKIAFGVGSAFAAIKVGGFLRDAVNEQREAARLGRQTAAVLRSTGGVANVTSGQIDRLAESLSKVAGIDDEVIQASENVLLRFTQIRNEAGKGNDIFNRATKAALDLSAAYGRDLTSTSIALGRALNNPLQGLLALQRVGVSFTASQRDQIKTLVESGHALDAQRVILDQIGARFGGAAAAAADPAAKLDVAIKNLKESIGAGLVPSLNVGAGILTKLADGFSHLPSPVQASVVALGGMALVAGPLLTVAANLKRLRLAIVDLPGKIYDAAGAFDRLVASSGTLGPAVAAIAVPLGFLINDLVKAKREQNDLTHALEQGGKAARESADAYLVGKVNSEGFAKALDVVGSSAADAVKAIKSGGPALADLEKKLLVGGLRNQALELEDLHTAYVKANQGVARATAAQKALGDNTKDTTGKEKAQTQTVDDLAQSYRDAANKAIDLYLGRLLDQANAAQSVESAESGLADAIHGTGTAAEDTTRKVRTYGDAVAAVFDSVLAADRAHIDVRESMKRLGETTTSFQRQASASARGLIRLDGQQASSADDVHGALLDVISAREAEVDAEAKSGEIADTTQARHQALIDSLLDLRNQYPALAGDIDRYIDAAKKIPELPLEEVAKRTAEKQGNLADATLRVVDALKQQAVADDDPIHGLETMDTKLQGLIDKYHAFPDAVKVFQAAIDAAIKSEAAILGIDPELLKSLLNPATGGNVARQIATPRASGGPVTAGVPYWVGEHHPELFVPSQSGTIVANPQTGADGGTTLHLEQHFHGDYDETSVGRIGSQGLRDAAYLMGV